MVSFTRRNLGLAAGMATAVVLTAGSMIMFSADATPLAEPGQMAPAITDAVTSTGETISLDQFSGKTVVLEWTNDGCPFVKKHYAEPVVNFQTMQSDASEDDIVWLSVISSAPGKQGYVDGAGAEAINAGRGAAPAYTILDPAGDIGRAYGAKTTPHMFVIKGDGEIAYAGAIDSIRSAKVDDIAEATNYVTAALDSVAAGEPVEIASTAPYGCSVKY
ncbi:MAG: redoxin family protein [Henriciella sp.]|nr:redoxin family protein [Henriciella sp.]